MCGRHNTTDMLKVRGPFGFGVLKNQWLGKRHREAPERGLCKGGGCGQASV